VDHGCPYLQFVTIESAHQGEICCHRLSISVHSEIGTRHTPCSKFRFNLNADFSGELGPGSWPLGNRFRFVSCAKVFGVEWDDEMDPPFFPEGGQNANVLTYDFMGRYMFSRLSYKF
jgi:hypothetical protein